MNDVLEYKGYFASIQFSADDEVFYGKLAGINDLVSFEGISVKELKTAFHEAVDDYLETCKEAGKLPDKVFKGVFNVRIPTELHRKAAIAAAVKNVTLNELVKTAIDKLINENNTEKVIAS